jgi:uncharacterized membrane protein YkgB
MHEFGSKTLAAPVRATADGVRIRQDCSAWLDRAGRIGLRYGLVAVIGWIGLMKFTAYEAEGISGFVANSPLMSWAYAIMSHRGFSALLGLVELAIAALVAFGPYRPRAGAVGAAGAVGMFLTTLSFLVTTPGVFEAGGSGFPALSAMPGQFLVKDFSLLGIAIWLLADAVRLGNLAAGQASSEGERCVGTSCNEG